MTYDIKVRANIEFYISEDVYKKLSIEPDCSSQILKDYLRDFIASKFSNKEEGTSISGVEIYRIS